MELVASTAVRAAGRPSAARSLGNPGAIPACPRLTWSVKVSTDLQVEEQLAVIVRANQELEKFHRGRLQP